jgi:DNA-binding NarL/FixJ family response regulator
VQQFDEGQALIVEDNLETRRWLADCVKSAFPALQQTLAASVAEAEPHLLGASLALIDLGLPDGSGLDLIRTLRQQNADCYVVVATIYDDDHNLFTALKSGAKGYVLKDQDRDKIVGYLQGIRHNRPVLSEASSQRLIDHFNSSGDVQSRELEQARLTPRETEVTCLIAKGYSTEEVAVLLQLAPDTVRGYVKSIYGKLQVSNRAEITLKAVRLGLIDAG